MPRYLLSGYIHRALHRRMHAHIQRVLAGAQGLIAVYQVERLCRLCRYAYAYHNDLYVRTFMIRTPVGMLVQLFPNTHLTPGYNPLSLEVYADQQFYQGDQAEIWERGLGNPASCALWASLPQGCTPLVGPMSSLHDSLAWMQAWRTSQQDVPGWSKEVFPYPLARSIQPGQDEGFGSCLIAVRQGLVVVILVTRLDIYGWTTRDARVPLPQARVAGIYRDQDDQGACP